MERSRKILEWTIAGGKGGWLPGPRPSEGQGTPKPNNPQVMEGGDCRSLTTVRRAHDEEERLWRMQVNLPAAERRAHDEEERLYNDTSCVCVILYTSTYINT